MKSFGRLHFLLSMMLFMAGLLLLSCSLPDIEDVTPPVVTLIYPAPGQAISGQVGISAAATDDNSIHLLKIYIDGVEQFNAEGNSIFYLWDTAPIADNRDHYILAAAVDKEGNIGHSPLVPVRVVSGVNPDTLAPFITILNPVQGQTVSGTVPVVTQVVDDSDVDRVEFFIDGQVSHTDNDNPFEYMWDVSGMANGSTHTLFARAFDKNEFNSVSGIVSVTVASDNIQDVNAPSLTILYPPQGAVFTSVDSITAVADAFDESGIKRVEFYVDGIIQFNDTTNPYQYQWPLVDYANGRLHTLYVKAYDNNDNASAAMVVVTINP